MAQYDVEEAASHLSELADKVAGGKKSSLQRARSSFKLFEYLQLLLLNQYGSQELAGKAGCHLISMIRWKK